MVLRNIITVTSRTFLFIAMALFFSCEDPGVIVINCSDCLDEEPVTARLKIKLEEPGYGYGTIIRIYQGNLEDSILYDTFSSSFSQIYREVPLNKTYTLTASYYIRGYNYIAVNSVTPHVLYDKDNCEEPCYYVYDNNVNLRLKYTKYGNR